MIVRALLIVVGLLVGAVPADAARVRMFTYPEDQRIDIAYPSALTFTAAAGERNDVRFSAVDDGFRIRDRGAQLKAAGDCERVTAHEVLCTPTTDDGVTLLANLGDRNDQFHAGDVGAAGVTVMGGSGNDTLVGSDDENQYPYEQLDGGPGADRLDGRGGSDVLKGGTGRDVLDGGAGDDKLYGDGGDDTLRGGSGHDLLFGADGPRLLGDDRLDGGPGSDTASYTNRRIPVRASLASGRAGATGEHDRLTSIENLAGSRQTADVLIGDEHANFLQGAGFFDDYTGTVRAGDRFDGRGGDDQIDIDGPGSDVECGSGDDTVQYSTSSDVLHASCEAVMLYAARVGLQPDAITPDTISFKTGCPNHPSTATLTLPGTTAARGGALATLLASGPLPAPDFQSFCEATLALTDSGKAALAGPRPLRVSFDNGEYFGWTFELTK